MKSPAPAPHLPAKDSSGRAPGFEWLQGGGEMGERIRAFDWASTPLGPVERWPAAFASTLGIVVAARFPMAIYWGEAGWLFYNDAWRPILGDKHPWALGKAAREVWPEIWEAIAPQFDTVRRTGEATWSADSLLPMQRFGYTEECYFDYTFNPIRGASGQVDGILNVVQETTERVLSGRRTELLRELSARTAAAKTEAAACEAAVAAFATDPADFPFTLLYLVDLTGRHARLIAADGVSPESPAHASEVFLDADNVAWPLGEALRTGGTVLVENIEQRFGTAFRSPWPEPVTRSLIMPIAGAAKEGYSAVLVVGANPRRSLDNDYRRLLELTVSHLATAIATANSYASERKRAESLAELDRAKTTFFSNVSHEFRTPLTLMLGPLEELRARAIDAPALVARDEIDVVHRNSLRLLKLVNTLLDFSRIEAGRAQAVFAGTDLAQLTADLASVFRSAMAKAELGFVIDCPPLPQPVFVDADLWEKIVFNLLSNALKFTLSGEVRVTLRAGPEHAVLSVSDTGLGIAPAELPNLFKRFHRIENVRGRTHEGTGIGLALVHELVKLHGGTIEVESEPGRGTEFRVRVPFGKRHLPGELIGAVSPAKPAPARADAFLGETLSWLPEPRGNGAATAATNSHAAIHTPQSPRPRILLAEDNADMRDYVRRLLSEHYEVQAVGDGAAALEAARRDPPDLLLSDVMMPAMNGFELAQRLRADETLRTLPIILLSARAGEEARIEGATQGADDYLTKPFSARELLARVALHLELARVRRNAAEEMRRSEERYRAVVENQVEMLCRFRPDGAIVFVNGAYARSRGTTQEALCGANFWDFIPEEGRAYVRALLDGLTPDSPQTMIENRFETTDGTRWTHWTNRALTFDEQGRWTEAQSTGFDITDRRQAEEALRTSEGRLRLFIDHAPAALAMLDHEMRYLAASQRWKDDYRLSGDLVGRSHYEIFPEIPAHWKEAHRRGLAGEVLRADEDPFPREDGTVQFIKWEVRPWMAAAGKIGGILIAAEDVTERKQATEALRESEARQTFLLKLGDALRLLADPVEIQATASRILGEHLGASRVAYFEVRGADYFVARDYVNGVAGLAGGYPIASFGERLLATYRDGQTACSRDFAADVTLSPEERAAYAAINVGAHVAVPLVKAGEFVGGLAVHESKPRDWTAAEIALVEETAERTWAAVERARAEAALRQARERFDIVKDSTQVGFWFCDLPFDKMDWDNRVKEHFWLLPEAVATIDTFYERMHPDDRAPTRQAIEVSLVNKTHYETEYRTVSPDGQVKWIRAIGRGFYNGNGQPIRFDGMTLDITARKRADEALRDSEAQLVAATTAGAIGTWNWDLALNLLTANPALLRIFGISPAAAVNGISPERFIAAIHPEDQPGARASIARALAPDSEGVYEAEYRVHSAGQVRWVLARGRVEYDAARKPLRLPGALTDITERKQAEAALQQALANEKAARAEADAANRSKDDFLAALSHELRTPLTPVLMTAAALKDDPRLSEDVREQLGMMERNIALEARLIDDLLDLTAISHGKFKMRLERCDLNTLVERAMGMVAQDAVAKNLVIACEFNAALPVLMADLTRLQQVVWNLLRNAVKFTPPGGRISIRTRDTLSAEGNPWLTLEVVDTGIGIEAPHLARIFQPFDQGALFGNHRFGGLGLGLAIAHAVVTAHGGRIQAQSNGAGQGATFTVHLPLGVAATTPAGPAGPGLPGQPAKIVPLRLLLVEDHPSTLQTLSRLLQRDGHQVTTATTLASALTAAAQGTFDLVISDLGLPDGSGTQLMDRLRSSHGLRGIALSGYGMQEDIARSREAGFVAHLVKPVAISDLRRAIADISRT